MDRAVTILDTAVQMEGTVVQMILDTEVGTTHVMPAVMVAEDRDTAMAPELTATPTAKAVNLVTVLIPFLDNNHNKGL